MASFNILPIRRAGDGSELIKIRVGQEGKRVESIMKVLQQAGHYGVLEADGVHLTEEDSVFPGDNLVFQPARDEEPRKRLKSSVSTQPLNDIPHDFVLPFKSRDALMLEVAKTIQSYVHTFATTSIKREDECRNGWVYVEQVEGGGWRYRSPRILVRSIAERIKVPARSIPILPVIAKGDPLEDAFLDTFLALLCLNEGKSIPLSNLIIGALGDDAILNMKVKIGREVMQVVEKYQIYNPRDRRFYHEGDAFTVGADEVIYYLHPCRRQSPRLPLLLRCKRIAAVTDARLFLRNGEGEVCEFWIQLKGGKDPMRKGDAEKCREAAFRPELKVPGRRKILVLCTTSGFSFHVSSIDERIEQEVLFMNLMHFMPDFLTHCVEN